VQTKVPIMKSHYRILALLSAFLLTASACGGQSTGEPDSTSGLHSDVTTAIDDITTRENTPDSLPADLNLNGRTITFSGGSGYSGGDSINELQGTENSGDIVNDAIYNRNIAVSERLNVNLEFTINTDSAGTYAGMLRTLVNAGDDTYDIMVCSQSYFMPLIVEGLFYDLIDAPYLDYSQPWWSNEYMNTISIHEGTRYALRGDLSISEMLYLSATYMNTRLYSDNFGDVNEFYNLVLDGKWTLEKLCEYSKKIYHDVNGNGVMDENDTIGFGAHNSGITDHIAYPAGIRYSERDENGYPRLIDDHSRNVKVVEALHKLYHETEGALGVPVAESDKVKSAFINGNCLFRPGLLGDTGGFREMKDDYTIIPTAKLDEEQPTYLSLVHDSASLYSIPITNADIDPACAVLEALCAETYRKVTLTYYEVALKVKYTRDNISAQFIDIIRENATTDFIYANNYALGAGSKLGTITRTLVQNKSTDYMSSYASLKSPLEEAINQMIEMSQKH